MSGRVGDEAGHTDREVPEQCSDMHIVEKPRGSIARTCHGDPVPRVVNVRFPWGNSSELSGYTSTLERCRVQDLRGGIARSAYIYM